jgi:hypothetical protein
MSVAMSMRRAALMLLVLAVGLLLAVAAMQIATPHSGQGPTPAANGPGGGSYYANSVAVIQA